ncbi:MFS transporter [Fodinisporobacter ferrooxydans]|uniref:MFS transporter n=1 Tax=Fodinisporobacter ferrooxydans TaxID=2901836 RepID=A0ABY4CG23_9BACL|nr:MFS transporter [Alicyclobacillaceae bacterium MYW30-H2]
MKTTELWKRNLVILWFGNFFVLAGMNLIIPFLPLYIQELGVKDIHHVELWAGVIFAGAPLLSATFSPLWGKLSDRYGRKIMLIRSGIGMGIVMILMGFAKSPLQLLLLRLMMGTISGFIPTSTALQATETPKEHAGRALGILQTGNVTGSLIGPLLGGVLAEWIGIRNVFYLTGTALLLAAIIVILGVHESKTYERFSFRRRVHRNLDRKRDSKESKSDANPPVTDKQRGIRSIVKEYPILLALFLSSFLIMAGMQSIEPIITVYIQSLHVQSHIAVVGGLVFAASGIGTILAAPILGRLGDRYGNQRILMAALLIMAVLYIPQAFVRTPWELMALRLLMGLCIGGLLPSINAMIRKVTPNASQGVVYGFNAAAVGFGSVGGPLFGGFIASHIGISYIFFFTSAFFLFNFLWIVYHVKTNAKSQAI